MLSSEDYELVIHPIVSIFQSGPDIAIPGVLAWSEILMIMMCKQHIYLEQVPCDQTLSVSG